MEITVKIVDKIGLHVRTANIMAKKANEFESSITVAYNNKEVNGKSMLSLMSLGAKKETEIRIKAEGNDAKDALDALKKLIENNFSQQ